MITATPGLEREFEGVMGLDFTEAHYERLVSDHVRKDLLGDEETLSQTRWFDYRFMNPAQSTYVYAYEYDKAYRIAYRKYVDGIRARFVRPRKHLNFFNDKPAAITALWRGRQHADAIGMPYQLYIYFALEERLRFWKRAYLPAPAQLYSIEVVKGVLEGWGEHLGSNLVVGKHRSYRNENYVGLPQQDAHHAWLMDLASTRTNVWGALADMLKLGVLPIEKIRDHFGDAVADRVLALD